VKATNFLKVAPFFQGR